MQCLHLPIRTKVQHRDITIGRSEAYAHLSLNTLQAAANSASIAMKGAGKEAAAVREELEAA